MKTIIIALISITMIFPATIFANDNSTASIEGAKQTIARLKTISSDLTKAGWESSSKKVNKNRRIKIYRNREKGLAAKVIAIKVKNKITLKMATYKTRFKSDNNLLDVDNVLASMRLTLDTNKMKTARGRVATRNDLDKRMNTFQKMIELKLQERENASYSIFKSLLNIIIPSAIAKTGARDCIKQMLFSAVAIAAIELAGRFINNGAFRYISNRTGSLAVMRVLIVAGVLVVIASAVSQIYMLYRGGKKCWEAIPE